MKIIHFGCWNYYKDEVSPFEYVLESIREHIIGKKDVVISVAGDNYYPEKQGNGKDKKKYIKPENLLKGFKQLTSLADENNIIIMIQGNHDLEKELLLDDNEPTENCELIVQEATLSKNITNKLFNSKYDKHSNTLILWIDTTMYVAEDEFSKYDECYGIFKYGTNQLRLQNVQKDFVLKNVTKHPGAKILLIGHHPIICIKKKKRRDQYPKDIPGIFDLLLVFKTNFITYLCADLHLYQEGTIELKNHMVIKQYIVGTGGTKLDDEPTTNLFTSDDENIASYSVEKQMRTHGFLSFNPEGDINFHSVEIPKSVSKSRSPVSITDVKGGKRRSRRSIRNKIRTTKRLL